MNWTGLTACYVCWSNICELKEKWKCEPERWKKTNRSVTNAPYPLIAVENAFSFCPQNFSNRAQTQSSCLCCCSGKVHCAPNLRSKSLNETIQGKPLTALKQECKDQPTFRPLGVFARKAKRSSISISAPQSSLCRKHLINWMWTTLESTNVVVPYLTTPPRFWGRSHDISALGHKILNCVCRSS